MQDWSRQHIWDDRVQTHIRTGQECRARGDVQAAADRFRIALEGLVRGYRRTDRLGRVSSKPAYDMNPALSEVCMKG